MYWERLIECVLNFFKFPFPALLYKGGFFLLEINNVVINVGIFHVDNLANVADIKKPGHAWLFQY